jgi:peptide/nickel transport system substrate-binding protein
LLDLVHLRRPNQTDAGAEPYRKPDLAKAKQLLAEGGYKGEKIVVLLPTDISYLNAAALVTIQTLKSIGMTVDAQSSDWATITGRRAKKEAPEAGGWNVYVTVAGEFDVNSPVTNAYLSAACGNALPGWPCDKPLDELRTAWIRETAPASGRSCSTASRSARSRPCRTPTSASTRRPSRPQVAEEPRRVLGHPTLWALDK